jgi:glucan phosphorylase
VVSGHLIANCNATIGLSIRIVFVENFNMHVAKLMTAGVDAWLNTPKDLSRLAGPAA